MVDFITFESGDMIDSYKLGTPLGDGGMSRVYSAEDLNNGSHVALKLVCQGDFPEKDFQTNLRLLRHEHLVSKRLNHPNLLQVNQFEEYQDFAYAVMPLVKGKTVEDLIEAGDLTTKQSLELMVQAADTIQYMHDLGLVHGDFKPGNVLVTKEYHLIICDFGLTRRFRGNPQGKDSRGFYLGTVDYIPPQQIGGRPDISSDIFSMAATLYLMFTGVVPFCHPLVPSDLDQELRKKARQGKISEDEVMVEFLAHADVEPRPARDLNEFIPLEVSDILDKGVRRNRSQRFQTAQELANQLRSALGKVEESPIEESHLSFFRVGHYEYPSSNHYF